MTVSTKAMVSWYGDNRLTIAIRELTLMTALLIA